MLNLFKFTGRKRKFETETFRLDGVESLEDRLLLAGEVELFDLEPGAFGSVPEELTDINRLLFFAAFSSGSGKELWTSDGTRAGTQQLKDILPGGGGPGQTGGSYPDDLAQVGGILLFDANGPTGGRELWASDGTNANTILLKDINPGGGFTYGGTGSNISGITGLGPLGGRAVFSAYNSANVGAGQELWISDTTNGGTFQLRNINRGFNPQGSNDGIPDFTSYHSFPAEFTNVGGNVFFSADDSVDLFGFGANRELWFTDGTNNNVPGEAKGTFEVADINPFGSSNPRQLTNHNGLLYFVASDGSTGRQIWRTNGTPQGTVRVTNINPNGGGGRMKNLRSVSGELYFTADNGTDGFELYKTSLLIEKTVPGGAVYIKDINPDGDSNPGDFTAIGETIFFSAYDSTFGLELWKTDGTTAGTVLLKDINQEPFTPVARSSDPENLTNVNGALFFSAYTIDSGVELWTSDGTTAGTVMYADINIKTDVGQPVGSYPSYFKLINGVLYFRANDGITGDEFYTLGPIVNGTSLNDKITIDVHDTEGVDVTVNDTVYKFGFTDDIFINAKRGYDTVEFFGTSRKETVVMQDGNLRVTGLRYDITVANVEEITADGRGGNDMLILLDSPGNDRFIGRSDLAEMFGPGYRLRGEGFENVTAYSTTGKDDALMYDSLGNDKYYAYDDRSIMQGAGFNNRAFNFTRNFGFASEGNDLAYLYDNNSSNRFYGQDNLAKFLGGTLFSQAEGFDFVNAYATGGVDQAIFYDTAGDDTYVARSDSAIMITTNGKNQANGFNRTYAYSTAGTDKAVMYDSPRSDTFYGLENSSRLVGAGFYNLASNFSNVRAIGSLGTDQAFLYDSVGNDRFYGRETSSQMVGQNFNNSVTNFDRVTATASGGTDFAYLYDSAGNDKFYGSKNETRMIGRGFINKARGFDKTFAFASDGNDIAYLKDTVGNDLFVGKSTFSLIKGAGLFNKVQGFDQVFATASRGTDRANLYDDATDDTFFGRRSFGKLQGAEFFYKADKFDIVNAYGTGGGSDTINNDALTYSFNRYGQWETFL